MGRGKIVLLIISITMLVLAGYSFLQHRAERRIEKLSASRIKVPKTAFSVLLLGADSVIPGDLVGWNGRSDFILVLYFNPKRKEVSLISVPRDTYITLKRYEHVHKINSANQFGGYKLSRNAVSRLLGIKIDYVIVFSLQAVIDLIDTIGPMKIYVPQKMIYHDNSANLHIDIDPGLQMMNGKKLMNFLRYRNKDMGDIGRIQRQQIFFRAAIKKLTEPEIIFRVPTILNKANKLFLTDMSFKKMFEMGLVLRALPKENFKSYIVPGDFGPNGYWLADYNKLEALMRKVVYEPSQTP